MAFAVRSWSGRVRYSERAQGVVAEEDDDGPLLTGEGDGSCYHYFPGGDAPEDEDWAETRLQPCEEAEEDDEWADDTRWRRCGTPRYAPEDDEVSDDEALVVDAQRRHRAMLRRMAADKAAEAEAKMVKEARETRRRATKTQKLAERAAARQKQRAAATATDDETPKASSDDEAARAAADEAARVERVRMTRRKQKARYKRLLETLVEQRRHEADLESTKASTDAEFRRKVRAAGMQRVRAALELQQQEDAHRVESGAVGSAVSAVRARQQQPQSSDEDEASRVKRRTREAKGLRERAKQHLERMVEERRQREAAEAAQAQRLARRQKIMGERILAESSSARINKNPEEEEEAADESEAVKKPTAAEQRAVVERLNSRRTACQPMAPAARDFADWKRKHGIAPEQRVFVMTGWYPCVREALVARGWVQNLDRDSPFFDLKWTLTSQHLRQSNLEPWQLSNHFQKTRSLVTKVGLSRSLDSLRWFARETTEGIFPRCYDLATPVEAQAFVEDFQTLQALKILQAIVAILPDDDEDNMRVNGAVYEAALGRCRRHRDRLRCDDLDDASSSSSLTVTTAAAEAELLGIVSARLDEEDASTVLRDAVRLPRRENESDKARNRVSERAALAGSFQVSRSALAQARAVLSDVASLSAQAGLDGLRSRVRNLWIVKPAAKSRGRGIATFRQLEPLFEYCDGSSLWVVQKYVENQMLIANRKFDLRQWVLVTTWNPLTIWFYDECYARFSAADFTADDDHLRDEYVHLVNNSISKHADGFHDAVHAENGVKIVDCMWNLDEFRDYVGWRHGREPFASCEAPHFDDTPRAEARFRPLDASRDDVFATHIQPAMQRIATCAFLCAQETVEHRLNSWELYGLDFMLDDTGKPWLIEINSSPACDYSTSVTETFVRRALVDILKVTLDHAEWKANGAGAPAPDTGGWRCIYVGPVLETPIAAFGGADIVCKGTNIPEPRDFRRAKRAAARVVTRQVAAVVGCETDAPVPSLPAATAPSPSDRLGFVEGPAEPYPPPPSSEIRGGNDHPVRRKLLHSASSVGLAAAKKATPPSAAKKPMAHVKITTVTMDLNP